MIDIIICTYNRPQKIVELVKSLVPYKSNYNKIIVVDSGDFPNQALKEIGEVLYLETNRKNQPYQRHLGYLSSDADYLLYLDDDREIVNNQVFSRINQCIMDYPDLSGIALNFIDKHSNSTLNEVPKSIILKKTGFAKRIIRWLTAIPELSEGKLGFCGNRGAQPPKGGRTQWLSGGAFLATKSALFQNFNFQMFDIFDKRLGMGEDAIIGYGLAQKGSLIFDPTISFLHNDQRDSSYSVDIFAYARRVMFSRLYLSLEIQRISSKSLFVARIHFHYYAFCRILGAFVNLLLAVKKKNLLYFQGMISGYFLTYKYKFNIVNESIL